MKFKVGDRVRVRRDLVPGKRYGNILFQSGMDKPEEQNIIFIDDRDRTYVTDEGYWMSEEMLEPIYGNAKNLISRTKIKDTTSKVHIHEIAEHPYAAVVKEPNGSIIEVQEIKSKKQSYKVIYNGLCTIVILSDGSKGIAKCNPNDRYIRQIGHDIAHKRARIKRLEKEIAELSKEGNA